MNAHNNRRSNARIIWAITAKDILESIKNKNTVTILVTSLLMVIFYRAMPALFHGNEPLNVLVYDHGEAAGQPSELVRTLQRDENLDIYTGYSSEEHMLRVLRNGDLPEIGLVIPADFDQGFAAGTPPPLQGYIVSWVSEEKIAEVHQFVEGELAQLTGVPVAVQLSGNILIRTPNSTGLGVQAGIAVIFSLVMIGISVVAHLMLEEKQTRTLDALLVSPANSGQIITAKALTGLFYCLLGAGVALVLNRELIIHWWLAILTVLVGAAFTVSLGLWLGTMTENRGQLTLFVWFFLMPLLLPTFLSVMTELLPAWLVPLIRAVPTTVVFSLLRTSYGNPISLGTVALQLAYLAAWTGAVFLIVVWMMRRQDQAASEMGGRRLVLAAESPLPSRPADFEPTSHQATESPGAIPAERSPPALALSPGLAEPPGTWGLIAAIAGKDIRDAIRNKLIISIILGVAVMVATNAFIPRLFNFGDTPTAIVFDEGSSTVLQELVSHDDFHLSPKDSRAALEESLSDEITPKLGLVIPANFDRLVNEGQDITLVGYYTHWADLDNINADVAFFEKALNVTIDYAGQPIYPTADAGGQPWLVTSVIVITLGVMGVSLVPLLMVEEKEAHTLDALLASPAGYLHIIAGKALAGFVYCLLTAAALYLAYQHLIVSLGIAFLAVLAITAFSVAVGLFVGMLSDSPTTTGMWGSLLLVGLLGSTVLESVNQTNWPAWFQSVVTWLPGTLMSDLIRYSLAGEVPAALWLPPLVYLFIQAGLVYLLVAWMLRQKDR